MRRESVHPSSQPPPGLADQQIHHGHRSIVVLAGEILALDSSHVVFEDVITDPLVGLVRPGKGTLLGPAGILALGRQGGGGVAVGGVEPLGPGAGDGPLVAAAAGAFGGDVGVPDGVEIGALGAEEDVDVVAAAALGLGVQRLVDVAEEVEQEPERLALVRRGAAGAHHPRRLVHDGGDDAALLRVAVASHVDAAFVRRVVPRVDVVPPRRVVEGGRASDLVRPQRRLGDVLRVEQGAGVAARVARQVFRGEVGDGAVAQGAPA